MALTSGTKLGPYFDDTQDNANHIHSVWRDFGGDLMKSYYETSHRNQKG